MNSESYNELTGRALVVAQPIQALLQIQAPIVCSAGLLADVIIAGGVVAA